MRKGEYRLDELIIFFEGLDTRVKRWMWREEAHFLTRRDLEGGELGIRQWWERVEWLESTKGSDHFLFSDRLSGSEIRPIFAIAGEFHRDESCTESEYNLEEHIDCLISEPSELSISCFIDHSSDDTGEKYDKRIEYSLEECHRDHITIENMCHLMSNHSLDLIERTLFQESSRYCHETRIPASASREGIHLRIDIDSNFWHCDSIFPGESNDEFIDFLFLWRGLIEILVIDEGDIICSFRRPSRDEKWDECSRETNDKRKYRNS